MKNPTYALLAIKAFLFAIFATAGLAQVQICNLGEPEYAAGCSLPAWMGGRWSNVYKGQSPAPDGNLYGFPERTNDVGHAVLLRNGLILAVNGRSAEVFIIETTEGPFGEPIVHGPFNPPLDPVSQEIRHPLFCSGQCQLPNGDIFFACGGQIGAEGGENPHSAVADCTIFELDGPTCAPGDINCHQVNLYEGGTFRFRWKAVDICPVERYYPTCTLLANGKVLIVGGRVENEFNNWRANIPMIFDYTKPAGQLCNILRNSGISEHFSLRLAA